jgi:GxxExxY protein
MASPAVRRDFCLGCSQKTQKYTEKFICCCLLNQREINFKQTKIIIEHINHLTYIVRGAIFEVHKTLGPGLLESVYEAALLHELGLQGLRVTAQQGVPVSYKNVKLELGFRMDLLVEDEVVIEIKSIETMHDVHKKQLLTYLKLSGKKIGILVNFNVVKLVDKESLIRIIN